MTLIYEVAQELHHTGDDAPAVTVGRLRNYNLMRYAAGNLREFIDYPSFKARAEKAKRKAAEAQRRIEQAHDWIEARQGKGGVDDRQLAGLWLLLDGDAALSNPPTSEERDG